MKREMGAKIEGVNQENYNQGAVIKENNANPKNRSKPSLGIGPIAKEEKKRNLLQEREGGGGGPRVR